MLYKFYKLLKIQKINFTHLGFPLIISWEKPTNPVRDTQIALDIALYQTVAKLRNNYILELLYIVEAGVLILTCLFFIFNLLSGRIEIVIK